MTKVNYNIILLFGLSETLHNNIFLDLERFNILGI